ncbi:MAG: histidine kinase [Bdellovibrionales bacterium]|nr:histidine kinase [Bdellovibrionales bacterium]
MTDWLAPVHHLCNTPRVMQNIFDKEQKQKWILLILAGVASLSTFYILYHFLQELTNHAINLLSVLINVINIYFFYQLFDLIHGMLKINPKSRWARFSVELIKTFPAIFIAGVINFHFISRPIFRVSFDPNYLFVILVFTIPSTVIAKIMFELRQAKEIALQSKLAQAEAQYNLLETQMQPHFLFNSLNVLSELIYVDPNLASSMTQQLADLYREILRNSKNKFSTLGSEISILKKYIQIQKIRFGERIQFRTDVPMDYDEIKVPSLILQTLVENAVKHGISPRQDGGEIELAVQKKGGYYEICIANTGELYDKSKPSLLKRNAQGTGLQNTKNRLDLFYGSSHGFNIYSDDKKTYVKFQVRGDDREGLFALAPKEEII